MSRHWLIGVSVFGHFALVSGVFLAGTAHLERLDPGRLTVNLTQPPPAPPAPAPMTGGPKPVDKPAADKPPEPPKPPKVRPRVTTQPEISNPEVPAAPRTDLPPGPGTGPGTGTELTDSPCLENCGDDPTTAQAVCGNNSLEQGEQCDDGNATAGDGCSAICRTEPKPIATISPEVMKGLRLSGETQLHPSAGTQQAIVRAGDSVTAIVKLCVTVDGHVSSAGILRSTNYPEYDATILAGVRGWRYQPYMLKNTPVPACSTVTFRYSVR